MRAMLALVLGGTTLGLLILWWRLRSVRYLEEEADWRGF